VATGCRIGSVLVFRVQFGRARITGITTDSAVFYQRLASPNFMMWCLRHLDAS